MTARMLRTVTMAITATAAVLVAEPAFSADPVARIAQGELVGVTVDGIDQYRGIPFAAPPIGPFRWRPPQPVAPWTGQRSATTFGAACLQPVRSVLARLAVATGIADGMSEDCLTLNVWTTAKPGDKQPVMVWIHGGGARNGTASNPRLDGTAFSRQGVVFVSLNYRLGRLGIFAPSALVQKAGSEPVGNYALMDQIAALRWVKTNIAAFGGDPGNVTVFGQSAGGHAILFLLATPSAKGLFDRAIVQSGGAQRGWRTPRGLAQQEEKDDAFVEDTFGHAMTAEALRQVPGQDLIPGRTETFAPFEDGTLVTETPLEAFEKGDAIHVPLVVGSTDDEAKTLMPTFKITPSAVLDALGPEGRALYADQGSTDEARARRAFTDAAMGVNARLIARESSRYAPTWLYAFSYVPERERTPDAGVGHGEELPFIFGRVDREGTAADRAEARLINGCWVSFARTGSPDACGTAWPRYDADTDQLLEFGNDGAVVRSHWRKPQLDFDEAHKPTLARPDAAR